MSRFFPKYIYALASIPWLFTFGLLSPRRRFLIFQIAKDFGLELPRAEESLPVTSVAELLEGRLDISFLEPVGSGGNVSTLELIVIASLARRADPPTAFEIGTFDGRTTLNIAANLQGNGKIFTLDLPRADLSETKFELAPGEAAFIDKPVSGAKYRGTQHEARITQLYGDSASFDFSPFEGQMGFIFVDGSHSYDYVRKDTATALRLAAEGAIILWHDYQQDWPGVIQALNEAKQLDPACHGLSRIEGTSLVMLKRENSCRSA
ncbi:MAG: class I SAM-dependent methyltransferase [Verrucomicrobiota bacterium]|nr:class I SAM-dependent methyltransferase [Verrucomicrobiota bacterium]